MEITSSICPRLTSHAQPEPKRVVAACFYFFAVEIWAAARVALDSRRRHGVARFRLASAAVATGLFGASILLAGIFSVTRPLRSSLASAYRNSSAGTGTNAGSVGLAS